MNLVDVIILAGIAVTALLGLKSGLLNPVSGIGGLLLGIIVAGQHHNELMTLLAPYIEQEMFRKAAAFITIVLAVAALTRVTAMLFKRLLSELALGWVDHAAGAFSGALLAFVALGTLVYVAGGINHAPTQEAIAASIVAPEVSRVSIVSASLPWCSSIDQSEAILGQNCTDFVAFAGETMGMDITEKVEGMLGGNDVGSLVEVVKSSFNGASPSEVALIANRGKSEQSE